MDPYGPNSSLAGSAYLFSGKVDLLQHSTVHFYPVFISPTQKTRFEKIDNEGDELVWGMKKEDLKNQELRV